MSVIGLSVRSKSRLDGVHPDLTRIVEKAAEKTPFIVTEGLRSLERQRELKRKGASRTLNSRHLTGHAVDLADIKATYSEFEMKKIVSAMKLAAAECGTKIECGHDWGWDSPHFQLPWKTYPGKRVIPATTQAVEAAKVAVSPRVVTGGLAGAAAAASQPEVAKEVVETVTSIPSPPASWTDSITNLELWQTMGEQLWMLKTWGEASPLFASAVLIVCVSIAFWPKKKEAS